MSKYTETKVVRLSKIQSETLDKISRKGVNVCQFIRLAIAEKIKKDYNKLVKKDKSYCPF